MNKVEIQEKKHLIKVTDLLNKALQDLDLKVEKYQKYIEDEVAYYGDNRSSIDHAEKINMRQLIEHKRMDVDRIKVNKKKLNKLLKSPYFGRLDFKINGSDDVIKIYIGIYNFGHSQESGSVIYDWRTPISSLFYDYEYGYGQYQAPSGLISGEILLKRQFRIRNGQMEFALEGSLNITDDVLQETLSRVSDKGMNNIVATIQRDQNVIIRNDHAPVMVIQGVAGSGKTSIALHRIAFLLYRFKETLTSDDILIISPNSVFADYISNVLPELGEESVQEIQMETLANEILEHQYIFQTFFEQGIELLEKNDKNLQARIKVKSSVDFLIKLDEYIKQVNKNLFIGEDIWLGGYLIPGWLFEEVFNSFSGYSKKECIKNIIDIIIQKAEREYDTKFKAEHRAKLKKAISKMHQGIVLLEAYKNFFIWLDKVDLFHYNKGGKLEYSDVFPMIYLKLGLEGKSIKIRKVKHLLIDEMQDYTPVQYVVISKIFNCNKTILGDINQLVNPYGSSTGQDIQEIFSNALYVTLNKSYRSSYEIMQFVQKISYNSELELLERHGQKPQIIKCKNALEEMEKIVQMSSIFLNSEYNALGIICKTQFQADRIFKLLQNNAIKAIILNNKSTKFNQGIIVCTAHMSKGLEFDQVIVPEATSENYRTLMDKNLLYIACTRAMHLLSLTYTNTFTKLIH